MTAIAILGMHRSGTSCLAGSLQQAGLYLGEVVEQAPHNKKGNRESLTIRGLNDRLLEANGGAWDLPPASLTWEPSFAAKRDAVLSVFENKGDWGFKDPRTLLTLPFWMAGIADLAYVGTFRHPLSVARSLLARDGIGRNKAFELWISYNTLLLSYWSQFQFSIISFDLPIADYAQRLTSICEQIGLDAGREGAKLNFFEQSLVHQHIANDQEDVPTKAMEIYQRLQSIAEDSVGDATNG